MSTDAEYKPGLEDVPAAKSAVSFLDGKKAVLEYRGIPVEVLAKESSFEEVSWLLIKGALPTQKELADFDHDLRQRRAIHYRLKDLIKCMPVSGHPMDALHASVAALGMFYPCPTVSDQAANWDATMRLLAALPTLVAAFARTRRGDEIIDPRADLDHAGNFYYMVFGKEPTPAVRKVLDACLILHAEHTMNASTFTARVTGSTLATPYQTMASAIGSLSGSLHGGANEEALRQFEEIGGPDNVKSWLDSKLAVNPKYKVMGIGHRVYKVLDPRAPHLRRLAIQLTEELGEPKWIKMSERIAEIMRERKKLEANVDFYSATVYYSLGIPTDLFTPIFAISRTSGWTAHVLEQLRNNRLYRPLTLYTGPKTLSPVPPIESR